MSATWRSCRERTRWFPALVSNHVVDLVNKYPREELPEALTGYIRDRDRLRLPPPRRGRLVERAASSATRSIDRFCVIGSVEEHIAKLQELAAAGVDQFNIYLMNGDEESILEVYGRAIVPRSGMSGPRWGDPDQTSRPGGEPAMRTLITNGTIVTAEWIGRRRRPHRRRDHRHDRTRPRRDGITAERRTMRRVALVPIG